MTTMLDVPTAHEPVAEASAITDSQQRECPSISPVITDAPAGASPTLPVSANANAAAATAEETSATDEEDDEIDADDPVSSLEHDATEFDKATITVVIQLLPHDGHADGRVALLGVKSHNLPPLTSTRRLAQLGPLPNELTQLLTRWEHHYREALTARTHKRAADKAKENAKEEERTRKQEEARRNAKSKPAAKAPQTRTGSMPAAATTPVPPVAVPDPQPAAAPQSTLF